MKFAFRIGTCLALLYLTAACGSNSDSGSKGLAHKVSEVAQYSGADRQEFLEKCAADESAVTFYTAQNDDLWKPYVAAFNKKYPNIKVNTTRRTSVDTGQAVIQEAKAGADKVDVLSITWTFFSGLKDYFIPIDSPEMDAYPVAAIIGDHQAVTVDRTPYGLIYNTNKVADADVPRKPEDLTDSRWKDEVAMSSSVQGTNWIGVMTHVLGDDVTKDLGKLNIRAQDVNSAAIASMVAAGEASIAPASPFANTLELQANGAPVKWSPVTAYWLDDLVGLSPKASSPCSGMLFIDFLISADGQVVNAHSLSAREGIPRNDMIAKSDFIDAFDPISLVDVVGDQEYSEAFAHWADLLESNIIRN